jgi:hypothetical protein
MAHLRAGSNWAIAKRLAASSITLPSQVVYAATSGTWAAFHSLGRSRLADCPRHMHPALPGTTLHAIWFSSPTYPQPSN